MMMSTWRIKYRLLTLALLPAVVVALVLTVYWTSIKVREIDAHMVTRGSIIVGFLSPAAEYGVLSGNRAFLRSASTRVRDEPDLLSIRIADEDGNLLYTHMREPQPSLRFHRLSELLFGHDTRSFEAPILLSSLDGFEQVADTNDPARIIGHVSISLSTVSTAVAQTEWILRSIGIIGFLLGVTALLVSRLERPLSRPLEDMAETVHRIGRGDMTARAPVHGGGELRTLANGINGMADNIERAHARMSERVSSATRDLQDQLKLIDEKNRELTVARGQADEANLKKSRLLASISHELRTPLSAIQGYVELLAQHGQLGEQEQSWLSIINTSSRDTLKLVNDLLDVSRIESGRISIHRSQFDLGQCLSEVIGICRRSACGHQVDVILVMDPETPTCLTCDVLRFKQVIANILSNALKFTRNGRVDLHTGLLQSDGRRQLEIRVRDHGPGIDPEDLPHIFEPFFQSRHPQVERPSGAGLGLSITRGIVQLLGGRILVDSTPGAGSVFTVILPLADSDVPLPCPPIPQSVGEVVMWCDDPDIRSALLRTLGVMPLPVHACGDLDEYLQRLGAQPRDIGIIWVRELPTAALDILYGHAPELARTVIVRGCLMDTQASGELLARGARFMPLTVSVATLNRAIQNLTLPALAAQSQPGADDTDATAPVHLDGRRFLVADDNSVNRRLLAEFIQRHGGLIEQVENGEEAVRAYLAQPPDLVFMDVHMPGKDGIVALGEIRAADPEARVVAVTADLRPETHIALLQHGFDQVLYKPISEKDVLGCVENSPVYRRHTRQDGGPARDTGQPLHDEQVALKRAGGNPQLARDMLDMLLRDVERIRRQVLEDMPDGDVLLELVHRVHGGARYCGTLRLAASSQALESAIRGGVDRQLPHLQSAWLDEMTALLEQRHALLESLHPAPRKEA